MKIEFEIRSLASLPENKDKLIAGIRDIFFETTSRKTFENEQDRQTFFESWTSFYIEQHADEVLLAVTGGNQVMAYLTGCRNSQAALGYLGPKVKSYSLFEDQFADCPAHLHINASGKFQGQGVGGKLIEDYIRRLKGDHVKGLHIVTGVDSRNIGFYRKHGFTREIERDFAGSRLRFMGIDLTSA